MKYFLMIFFTLNLYSVECDRAKESNPCYGECGNFRDLNSNGICDIWESYHKNFKIEKKDLNLKSNIKKEKINKISDDKLLEEKKLKSSLEKNKDIKEEDLKNKQENKIENTDLKKYNENKIMKFGILWILIANIFLVVISEIFASGSNFLRILWNWVLLISFVICSLSGFFMYFGLLLDIKSTLFKLHMQSSVILFITGMYHLLKRFRCMI